MKPEPLDDLEMFELLQLAYPGQFDGDDEEAWDKALSFADELSGFDQLADLLGRVVIMAPTMESPLTKRLYHVLGRLEPMKDGNYAMIAVVRRLAGDQDAG